MKSNGLGVLGAPLDVDLAAVLDGDVFLAVLALATGTPLREFVTDQKTGVALGPVQWEQHKAVRKYRNVKNA